MTQNQHSELWEKVELCREQQEESPFSHTVAAGWYADDVPGLIEQLETVQRERDEDAAAWEDMRQYNIRLEERSREEIFVAVAEAKRAEEQFDAAMDCMNYAWTIICNVNEGDWTKQNQKWQDAAARCRDQYHALLASNPASERQ